MNERLFSWSSYSNHAQRTNFKEKNFNITRIYCFKIMPHIIPCLFVRFGTFLWETCLFFEYLYSWPEHSLKHYGIPKLVVWHDSTLPARSLSTFLHTHTACSRSITQHSNSNRSLEQFGSPERHAACLYHPITITVAWNARKLNTVPLSQSQLIRSASSRS